jgi:hypothetical protein
MSVSVKEESCIPGAPYPPCTGWLRTGDDELHYYYYFFLFLSSHMVSNNPSPLLLLEN